MNKIKIVLFYVIIVLIVGCRAKKNVSEKYVSIKNDSINRTIQLNTGNKLIIENICDSINFTGKDFTNTINTGLSKTKVSIKDNKLTVETKSDSIVYVDKIVKETEYVDKIETITVYKTPSFAWWYMVIVTLAALVGWKVWRLF